MTHDRLLSFFLAQVFGLYFFISAVIGLYRADYYRKMIADFRGMDYNGLYAALLGLFIGLCLALAQNNWENRNQVFLTVISWSILTKALCWLIIPEKTLQAVKRLGTSPAYYVMNIVFLLVGLVLINKSFYLFFLRAELFSRFVPN